MKLSASSATPLYLQLHDDLVKNIRNNHLKPGDRLPTESELRETYSVSRVTVRKALGALVEEGYLDRKSGKGTFIRTPKIQRGRSSNALSFSRMCELRGLKPGAQVIKMALEAPSNKARETLQLTPQQKVLNIERVRTADDTPVILEINTFPDSFSFLFSENLNDTSLYKLLEDKYDIILDNSSKTIDMVFADHKQAEPLNVKKGYPLLRFNSMVRDKENKVINLCQQLCLGDKFKLIV